MHSSSCTTMPVAATLRLPRWLHFFAASRGKGGSPAPDLGGDFVPSSRSGAKACDCCYAAIPIGGGHLLSSQEISASEEYLKYRRESDRMGKELADIRTEVQGVRTPWLICGQCIEMFVASGSDRAAARDRAGGWWASQAPDERGSGGKSKAPLIAGIAVIAVAALAAAYFFVLKPKAGVDVGAAPPPMSSPSTPANPVTETATGPIDVASAEPVVPGDEVAGPLSPDEPAAVEPAPEADTAVVDAPVTPADEPAAAETPSATVDESAAEAGTSEAPAPEESIEERGEALMADARQAMVGAGVPEGVADEILANPMAMMTDPATQARVGQQLAEAGVDGATVQATMMAWAEEHSDELMELMAAGPMVAAGPAPTGSPLDRLHRRYPSLDFEPMPNGAVVSSTGQVFLIRGSYVFPVEKDFTIGRVI